MKFKSIFAVAALCLAAVACSEKENPTDPAGQATEYKGDYVVALPSGVAASDPVEETIIVKDLKGGKGTMAFPAFNFMDAHKLAAFEIEGVSFVEQGNLTIVSHEGNVELKSEAGKKVVFAGLHGTIADGVLHVVYDLNFHMTSENVLPLHAYFNTPTVPADADVYNGKLTVMKKTVIETPVYLEMSADYSSCTITVPSYEMDAMGQTMVMPQFVFKNVILGEDDDFNLTYSLENLPLDVTIDGQLYHITAFEGVDIETEDFVGTNMTLNYTVQPDGMPMGIPHTFTGYMEYPPVE